MVTTDREKEHTAFSRRMSARTNGPDGLSADFGTTLPARRAPSATVRRLSRRARAGLRLALAAALMHLASGLLPAAVPAALAQQATPAQIDRNGVLTLIRTALLALDAANKTGNYTVLRDLGSPEFRTNTAADLAEIFAKQRKDGLDLSAVAVLEPQLTVLPQIEPNGLMRMAGFFPSVDRQVNFELGYVPVNGQWRLFGISVALGSSAPVPPPAVSEAPADAAPAVGQPRKARPPKPPRPPAER